MIANAVKAVVVLFAAVLVQISLASAYAPFGGSANVVLVVLICAALLRGSIFGAAAGFTTGLLLDTANLGLLGFTSLLLTLAGFWTGRYRETTSGERFQAPYIAVALITVLYALGTIALGFVLGESVPAGEILDGLPATVLLNLLLTWPVYWFARRLFAPAGHAERVHEVRLLG